MPAKFYVTEKLSFRKWRTPEGFLICYDAPLARTGEMLYGPGETPVDVGADGLAHIEREASEVFRPETLQSAEGKPVVNEHPVHDVTPETWKKLALGHIMNVRRGSGPESDLLLADLLIADKDAIDLIESGKRELSCGYSADYDQFAPGFGRQRNILINHVALVEQGRCGPRCAIGDRKPKDISMKPKSAFQRWLDKARGHALIGDEQAAVQMLKEGPARQTTDDPEEEDMKKRLGRDDDESGGHHTHIHLPQSGNRHDDDDDEEGTHSVEARIEKVEQTVKGLATALSKVIAILEKAGSGEEGVEEHDDGGRRKGHAKRRDDDDDDDDDDDGRHRKHHDDDDDAGKRHRKGKDADDPEKEDKEIEGRLEEEAPPGSEEKATKARDSAYLVDSFRQTVALAEILAPGIRIPTFDRSMKPVTGYKQICSLRRQALDLAYHQPDGRSVIEAVNGNRAFNARDAGCSKVRNMFLAAAAMKRDANNGQIGARTSLDGLDLGASPAGISSVNELQAIHDATYSRKSS